ncbi:MAG: hypothetical protein KDA86_22595 [Planctomycetaceae bacterium]|nr:hypothetical protein [Planctomycetaceae bacterium]
MSKYAAPQTMRESRFPGFAGLAWVILFALWFYSLTLPNAQTTDGTSISRVDLWTNLSDLLLENVFPTKDGNSPPSGWQYLPQRFDLVAVAGFILAGAWGLGHLLLRATGVRSHVDAVELNVFAFGLGLSGLSLLTLGFGVVGLLSRWLLGGVIVASLAGELWLRVLQKRETSSTPEQEQVERKPREISELAVVILLCVLPFLVAMLLGAMLPSTDFDVKEYHLEGPKEYFQQGRVTFLPHNVYTSFPFLTEMLSLLAMVLRDDWYRGAMAGKAVLMAFAPLTSLGLFAAGRRWFNPTVGWLCVLIYLTTPWVYRISIIAYTEGGLAFFLLVTLLAVLLLDVHKHMGLVAGWLAGSAVACKYPGVLSVAIPLFGWTIFSTLRSDGFKRSLRVAILFAIGSLMTFGPWMLKNAVETGNPLYPLMYTVFGGEDWNDVLNAKWRNGHSPPKHLLANPSQIPGDLWRHAIDVIAKSDWQSALVFAFAPLSLMWRRHRKLILALWVYVLWLFFTWWGLTHRIDRFWVPMLPVLCLLAGIGMGWLLAVDRKTADVQKEQPLQPNQMLIGGLVCLVVALSLLFNLGYITTPLAGFNGFLMEQSSARRQAITPSMALLNEMDLPDDARVLFVGEAQVFDAEFDNVYNTVFDVSLFQEWLSATPELPDGEQSLKTADEIRSTLRDHGITHVFVNWQEVLRYRAPGSYGYTEFVTPQRFRELVEMGVLKEQATDPRYAWMPWDAVAPNQQQEVAALHRRARDQEIFIRYQLFEVQ